MGYVLSVLNFEDGFYTVKIKPAIVESYSREFSKAGLEEFVEATKHYCNWKGYEFIYNDLNDTAERIYSTNDDGVESNSYILVDCHYDEKKDAKGKSDAVMFEVGEYTGASGKYPFDINSIVTVSTTDARLFAKAILALCNEIEGDLNG